MSTADRNEAINGAIGHLQTMRGHPSRYVLQELPRVRELLDIAEREARATVEACRKGGAEQLLLMAEG